MDTDDYSIIVGHWACRCAPVPSVVPAYYSVRAGARGVAG